MSDTNPEAVSTDFDPEVAAHASVVTAFKKAFTTYEKALETLEEDGRARLKHAVDTRFLGKPAKGKGGRPAGSGQGASTGTRSPRTRA